MADLNLWEIEPIVTPQKGQELGVHRMRVPGGWLVWLAPTGGVYVASFVPDPAITLLTATGDVVPAEKITEQRAEIAKAIDLGLLV